MMHRQVSRTGWIACVCVLLIAMAGCGDDAASSENNDDGRGAYGPDAPGLDDHGDAGTDTGDQEGAEGLGVGFGGQENGDLISPADNCTAAANPQAANTDSDALIDGCDPDDDNDGVADIEDNCARAPNPEQADSDGDGHGDACDDDGLEIHDRDGDAVADSRDNCPSLANADQADSNQDGVGDACSSSIDDNGSSNDDNGSSNDDNGSSNDDNGSSSDDNGSSNQSDDCDHPGRPWWDDDHPGQHNGHDEHPGQGNHGHNDC